MALRPRSSVIEPGDTVRLRTRFRGPNGQYTDLDAFPMVTIIQPTGGIAVGPTSSGVFREDVGVYGFDFEIALQTSLGVWVDVWQGTLNGFTVLSEFTFQVNTTQLPAINSDGYRHLGDDVGFDYSQIAIANINDLLKLLRARLKSAGKHKTKDEFGNDIFVDCDIYTTAELVTFLVMSLSQFNETPHFTAFAFDDTPIIQTFMGILEQGASLM